jgi:hypothetical protein
VRSKGAGGGVSINLSRRALIIAGVVLLLLIGLGVGLGVGLSGGGSGGGGNTSTSVMIQPPKLGGPGPEGPPLEPGPALAPASSPSPGQTVDGITCGAGEQVAVHIHIRLTIFVDGKPRSVPYGVGISSPQATPTAKGPFVSTGACFSWLHTHASDGIVHIESPVQRTYTLGNFFDIWSQPLSATQVGPAHGKVTAFLNGKVWNGDPRSIPFAEHNQIQLDVGRPLVAPVNMPSSSWGGL